VEKRMGSPIQQELAKCMELHCRKYFGEKIAPIEKCINFSTQILPEWMRSVKR